MKLQDVYKLAWTHATKRRKRGEVPTFLGLSGMLALMYDNIRRFNMDEDNYDEVIELATNAMFALELVCDRVLPGGEGESIRDEPEEEEEEEPKPLQPIPPPPRFDGWQMDPHRAVALRKWALKTGQWALLTEEQREGIEDVICDMQEGPTDEESEGEEEHEEAEQEATE